MKKVLIAVDDSLGSEKAMQAFTELYSCSRPEQVVLLYVQKIEGRSLMDEMLGEAEMSTLKEMLKETEHQALLDKTAEKIIQYHSRKLEEKGISGIKPVVKTGHPADSILETAKEEEAGMIIIGSRGKRLHSFLMGSVSREVANRADVPVLIAR